MPTDASTRRPRIGLALGGGAARGWAHIGVIEALAEAGIEPDIVCGTSMGALVGAAYVAGRLPGLRTFAAGVTRRTMIGFLDVRLTGGGLVDGKRIVAMLHELGIDAPIERYGKPFIAVATNLESSREVWLRDGPILDAVRASISLPGIFSPVLSDGRWLADGGLVNPVPVSACRSLGADIIIAVNLNGDIVGRFGEDSRPPDGAGPGGRSPEFVRRVLEQMPPAIRRQASAIVPKLLRPASGAPGYLDVLINSINIMQDQITRSRLAGEPPHVLIAPRLRRIASLEFNRADEAIAEGRACVRRALPEIHAQIAMA